MLAAAVYAGKRFFMEQADKIMLCGHLLHDFHGKLVMVGRNVGGCINGRKLMLGGSHFIVFCFCQNPQLPELLVELLHIGGDPRLDHAEIVVVHFLPLGRLGAEQSTAGKAQIWARVVQFF